MTHVIIDKMLTSDQCADIINQLPNKSRNKHGGTELKDPGYWTSVVWKDSHKAFNTRRIKLEKELAAYISSLIKPVSIGSDTVTVLDSDFFYVNYYNPGEGCVPHNDPSKYSICVSLNDEYEGGEFSVDSIPVDLKAGDGILFTSDNTHAVSEIVSGNRWSLCIWIYR